MRRYQVEVSGLPDEVADGEVRAAIAERISQLHRVRGGTGGLSVATSNDLRWEVDDALAALSPHDSRHVHNVHAHPLLVLCPPLGEWLHARTEP